MLDVDEDVEKVITATSAPFPMDEFDSYLYGLVITDGNVYLSGNKGRIAIELQRGDEGLLVALARHVPSASVTRRKRDTNFKKGYESSTFAESNAWFRNRLFAQGMPQRDKSVIGAPPTCQYVESAFWRGVFDGNGSNGITATNTPFISLTTKSEPLKVCLCELLYKRFGIKKSVNRNKRDDIYNIMLTGEHAVAFMDYLYEGATIWLERKHEKYLLCKQWTPTPSLRPRKWTVDDDLYVISHDIKTSMEHLGRTYNAVYQRIRRLKQGAMQGVTGQASFTPA